ncbi:MAG TPA: alpha/beta hydrolase [Acidobacteriaceae bacterium]|nr:alpha/beta hydrolase [Acidobacteriaceae bacterium]
MVVQGEDDEYGTWAQVDAIRAGSGGSVEVLAVRACGHSPHREHPDVVLAEMARFVQTLQ